MGPSTRILLHGNLISLCNSLLNDRTRSLFLFTAFSYDIHEYIQTEDVCSYGIRTADLRYQTQSFYQLCHNQSPSRSCIVSKYCRTLSKVSNKTLEIFKNLASSLASFSQLAWSKKIRLAFQFEACNWSLAFLKLKVGHSRPLHSFLSSFQQ